MAGDREFYDGLRKTYKERIARTGTGSFLKPFADFADFAPVINEQNLKSCNEECHTIDRSAFYYEHPQSCEYLCKELSNWRGDIIERSAKFHNYPEPWFWYVFDEMAKEIVSGHLASVLPAEKNKRKILTAEVAILVYNIAALRDPKYFAQDEGAWDVECMINHECFPLSWGNFRIIMSHSRDLVAMVQEKWKSLIVAKPFSSTPTGNNNVIVIKEIHVFPNELLKKRLKYLSIERNGLYLQEQTPNSEVGFVKNLEAIDALRLVFYQSLQLLCEIKAGFFDEKAGNSNERQILNVVHFIDKVVVFFSDFIKEKVSVKKSEDNYFFFDATDFKNFKTLDRLSTQMTSNFSWCDTCPQYVTSSCCLTKKIL